MGKSALPGSSWRVGCGATGRHRSAPAGQASRADALRCAARIIRCSTRASCTLHTARTPPWGALCAPLPLVPAEQTNTHSQWLLACIEPIVLLQMQAPSER